MFKQVNIVCYFYSKEREREREKKKEWEDIEHM